MAERATKRSSRAVAISVLLLALAPLIGLTGCGRVSLPVAVLTDWVVDGTRSTPPRGTDPAKPDRRLPITIYYPTQGGPFPLVVFAHGFDVNPAYYDTLLRALASSGYVVVAPEFPISGSSSPQPAGRYDFAGQVGDLSVVADRMLTLWPQRPIIDAERIAAVGHSDGGITVSGLAQIAGYQDTRFSTYVVLAGAVPTELGNVVGQPGALLSMNGDHDTINLPAYARNVYDVAGNPRAFTSIVGAGHSWPYIGSGDLPATTRWAIVDFLDLFVKGSPDAQKWWDNDKNAPGMLSTVQSGF